MRSILPFYTIFMVPRIFLRITFLDFIVWSHRQSRRGEVSCRKCKMINREYELLPKRKVWIAPWEEVAVDMIGPYDIKVNGRIIEFLALKCIENTMRI